ncbi:DNA glycosylase [Xylariaceae sp. FL1272]|nr:DNA glycosylase [Xylariaceae sp. FL1272]
MCVHLFTNLGPSAPYPAGFVPHNYHARTNPARRNTLALCIRAEVVFICGHIVNTRLLPCAEVMESMGSFEDDDQAQSATKTLARDLMFGFDGVKDDDEMQYLADLIIDGVGAAEDIDEFFQLSLFQGVEQWDQAVCCGKSLQERDPSFDLLEGNDGLTFLAKVYGLSSPIGDANAQDASPRPVRLKRRPKLITRAKIDPNAKNISPYWHNTIDATECEGEIGSTHRQPRKLPKHLSEPTVPDYPVVATYASDEPVSLQSPPSQVIRNKHSDVRPLTRLETASFRDGLAGHHQASVHGLLNQPSLDDSEFSFEDAETSGDPGYATYKKRVSKSPFFHNESLSKSPRNSRRPRGTVSSIPFPRLDSPEFGLIQEELADDPFRLLIAVTFLIRTTGKTAIPVFRALVQRYPTPRALAEANSSDILMMVRHLGLGAVRTAAIVSKVQEGLLDIQVLIQRYARIWTEDPPRNGIRYGVKNYPRLRDGADVKAGEMLENGDMRASAWEIGHGITNGPYAIDSWRIFCRDVLRGEALDWNGRGRDGKFQPEWMRVLPQDKELRACLRWKWLQEGWEWDPATGEKEVLSADTYKAVQEGRVGYDEHTGGLRISPQAA